MGHMTSPFDAQLTGTEKAKRQPLARREASILSPLRYPGSKRRLAGYIAALLRENGMRPVLLVEPFAGGASVSLQLLNDGIVDGIALGESDSYQARRDVP